jgi:hypothetical protein
MERTSENSSFIQLEGMHYLSFFLACQMHESSRRRTRNKRTRNKRTRFLIFYLSPNACTLPLMQHATNACRRCAAAA